MLKLQDNVEIASKSNSEILALLFLLFGVLRPFDTFQVISGAVS